ncbi:type VII secretion-associated protein [uncultured Williamsia sp.]|uniref:type VII secretion-associated protein n=1 Tax=uncultured Williamsia sp. TaxID=259311 RepID=UPI00261E5C9E|nr:type VII secretion-associated protein [uncultured Williamsia sp.]
MVPAVAARGATVLDVAYGRLESSAGTGLRVGALVSAIDAGSVVVGGRRRHPRDAWASAVAEAVGRDLPTRVILAHPSTWGRRRVGVLLDAVEAVVGGTATVTAQPRATLLAATNLESSVLACVLLEAHDDRVDVHRLQRSADGWRIGRTVVLDADCTPDELADLVDDAVEVVLVDGDRADRVDTVVDLVADATPTGRIAAVDRALLHRFGPPRAPRPSPPPSPRLGKPGPARILVAAGVFVMAVAVVVGLVVWRGGGDDPAPRAATETAQIGRVSLTVPQGWRRTSDPPDATGAIGFTSIASPADDRRLLLVQNAVRVDSTLDSVATSLRNRLGQRGTDAVAEFSADTTFAGRRVISYRETPGSGAPIRWYVVVSSALQASVGCQPGSQGESIDDACAAAVGSVTIAPL